jgi:hypothetical protein
MAEGWATYFGSSVREFMGEYDPAHYVHCHGFAAPNPGYAWIRISYALEDGSPFQGMRGEASEAAVQFALWDVHDVAWSNDGNLDDDDPVDGSFGFNGGLTGAQVMWADFVGPFKLLPSGEHTFESFWNGLTQPVNYGYYRKLQDTFDAWGICVNNGLGEPNNSAATATPVVLGQWTVGKRLYYSGAIPPAPGYNDTDFYSVSLTAGQAIEVETRYNESVLYPRTGCDPYLTVRDPAGATVQQADGGGWGRNARTTFTATVAGQYTVEVRASTGGMEASQRRIGIYDLRVQVLP